MVQLNQWPGLVVANRLLGFGWLNLVWWWQIGVARVCRGFWVILGFEDRSWVMVSWFFWVLKIGLRLWCLIGSGGL